MVEDGDARRDVRLAAPVNVHARARASLPGRRHAAPTLALDAFDLRAESAKPLVDALVALVDLVDGADRRRAVRAEAREQHRHPGADVRAFHALAAQLRGAGDDSSVRVAKDDPRAHAHELVRE